MKPIKKANRVAHTIGFSPSLQPIPPSNRTMKSMQLPSAFLGRVPGRSKCIGDKSSRTSDWPRGNTEAHLSDTWSQKWFSGGANTRLGNETKYDPVGEQRNREDTHPEEELAVADRPHFFFRHLLSAGELVD